MSLLSCFSHPTRLSLTVIIDQDISTMREPSVMADGLSAYRSQWKTTVVFVNLKQINYPRPFPLSLLYPFLYLFPCVLLRLPCALLVSLAPLGASHCVPLVPLPVRTWIGFPPQRARVGPSFG